MKKYLLKNMGCKANQLEGSLIDENLQDSDFEKVSDLKESDYFILNSCTVTHKSDNEAFCILKNAKKNNPEVKTVLTGCIAQIEKENLLENDFIDIVIGNDEKLRISEYLISETPCAVEDIFKLNEFSKVLLKNTHKTRASLKIQDGCDNRCSYCIIPFARGKNRSAESDFIIDQIKLYEDAGFKEIVLTGIHIGQWGKDFKDKKNLFNLLQDIEEKTKIERFRLGSLNPLEIDTEMLSFLKNSEKFCPHFHLSLQSMCDKTLKSMNRHYSAQRALELIEEISQTFALPFMGSDVIAGFPGESEEDFATTVENLKKSKLTQIHTFPYSIRKGTVAQNLENHLDSKVKEQRAKIIKEISEKKHKQFIIDNLNTEQEIIIEKRLDAKTGCLKGVTKNYITVLIKPENNIELKNIQGSIQRVSICEADEKVYAKILSN